MRMKLKMKLDETGKASSCSYCSSAKLAGPEPLRRAIDRWDAESGAQGTESFTWASSGSGVKI
jgi:hypothetical protein